MVKYLDGGSSSTSDPEKDIDVESDCDEVSDEPPDTNEKAEQTRVVLATGSFSAYAHFSRNPSVLREMTGSSAGSVCSSTVARTGSRSLPSAKKPSRISKVR